LAREVAKSIAHHPLLLADGLLDEARRFAMLSGMSGASDEVVIAQLGTPPEAMTIARQFNGLTLEELMVVDRWTRLNLWCAHFATLPETKFGAGFVSAMEEGQRYGDRPQGKTH
jgi:hypothetical protein